MKSQFAIIILFLAIFSSCEMSGENEIYKDLQIVNNGEVVLDLSDIDYYDFSTHIVYLKENNRLAGDYDKLQGAKVKAMVRKLYLKIHELSSSTDRNTHIYRLLDHFGILRQISNNQVKHPKQCHS